MSLDWPPVVTARKHNPPKKKGWSWSSLLYNCLFWFCFILFLFKMAYVLIHVLCVQHKGGISLHNGNKAETLEPWKQNADCSQESTSTEIEGQMWVSCLQLCSPTGLSHPPQHITWLAGKKQKVHCCTRSDYLFFPMKGFFLFFRSFSWKVKGQGCRMCPDCKALWGKFAICDNELYKINWI